MPYYRYLLYIYILCYIVNYLVDRDLKDVYIWNFEFVIKLYVIVIWNIAHIKNYSYGYLFLKCYYAFRFAWNISIGKYL